MFEKWWENHKNRRREDYQRGQNAVAQEVAAQDHADRQVLNRAAMKTAAETIDLANEMAKDGDPHKQLLATIIKDSVVGATGQVAATTTPQGGREAIEADPFDGSPKSEVSPKSVTFSSASTRALPSTEPQTPPKRGRGRPRKHPKS